MLCQYDADLSHQILFVRIVGIPEDKTRLQENINHEIKRIEEQMPLALSLFQASHQSSHYGLTRHADQFWGRASGWLFKKNAVLNHNHDDQSLHATGDLASSRFVRDGMPYIQDADNFSQIKQKIDGNNTLGQVSSFAEAEKIFLENRSLVTEHLLKVSSSDVQGILVDSRSPEGISQAFLIAKSYQERFHHSPIFYTYDHEQGKLYRVDEEYLNETMYAHLLKTLFPVIKCIDFQERPTKITIDYEDNYQELLFLEEVFSAFDDEAYIISAQAPPSGLYPLLISLFQQRIEATRSSILDNYIEGTGKVIFNQSPEELLNEKEIRFLIQQREDKGDILTKYKPFQPPSGLVDQTTTFPGHMTYDKKAIYYQIGEVLESLAKLKRKTPALKRGEHEGSDTSQGSSQKKFKPN